jgi:hypothetical protein
MSTQSSASAEQLLDPAVSRRVAELAEVRGVIENRLGFPVNPTLLTAKWWDSGDAPLTRTTLYIATLRAASSSTWSQQDQRLRPSGVVLRPEMARRLDHERQ